ncbi:hemerythrin domain-containing protein [Shewanella yunxiaonensis]|uniref:Hemerythrin domain-containing protein n=1 Tax=Shewanella yunxiaonensis TaxID=2829809 RepID=A0ABX7YQI1_9GAMM|nr:MULTISPECIES: hemerythrin domain-containing protein [Shewanella]MDF0534458.1 hemerythrin domain-containing protein [Shewanella sp. A32]QUN04915.1 hemerythrin domain-containing protein [Shewanella yunxiaonensis]
MLQRLMNDHKHIAVLLNLLKGKYQKLAEGEQVNFCLVRDVVEYMQEYADHSHHPVEDIVYEYYVGKFAKEESTKRLTEEHGKVVAASAALASTLNLILNDIVVAKEKLVQELRDYVTLQEQHMIYEEEYIFPKLQRKLTESDWEQIERNCALKLIDDPLFSSDDQMFDELRQYIQTVEPTSGMSLGH